MFSQCSGDPSHRCELYPDTRIQDSSSDIQQTSPSSPSVNFHLRRSGNLEAATSSVAGVGVVLSERAEAARLDWIPVDRQLCCM